MTDDTDDIIANLEGMDTIRQPVMKAAVNTLHLPAGSLGIDIGCGIGDQAVLLADTIGPAGHVVGLDISRPLLEYARRKAHLSDLAGRVSFEQGDLRSLPHARDAFHWAWSVDCVGYPAGELLPILEGIRRVVQPGGLIALLGWTSQRVLPGHAILEARLNANCSAFAPYLDAQPPSAHFERALYSFQQAGLDRVACTALVGLVQPPISTETRDAMVLLFEMLWGESIPDAPDEDVEEYRRLCSPNSSEFILDTPGYCGSFTYTMFYGRVPS